MFYAHPDPAPPGHDFAPQSFWTRHVWSQDHKVITVQYSFMAIAIGLAGLVLSDLMRLQLGFPGKFDFIDANHYYQFVTTHGMIMVIYLLTALFLGDSGNYLIPLMPGARDMVFPFLNMFSYWVYLLVVLVLVASLFVSGGPTGAGWTLYPLQAILPGTPGTEQGTALMLVLLAIFIVAATIDGLNYVTTTLQARTCGVTLMCMPLMVWGIFTTTVLVLLAFSALFMSAIVMLLDKMLGTSLFMPAVVLMGRQPNRSGGSPLLFQHLFRFFGHPETYIVVPSAFSIVSDLISTHARKNVFDYRMMAWTTLIIGVLSFIVWAHHMFVAGMNPYSGFFFATTTLIIAIPTTFKVYNWVLALWRGDIHPTVLMLFAIGSINTFVIDGLTGPFLDNVSVDIPFSNTYFVVAHFHMVVGVPSILAVFGGLYHWYPKMTGRTLNDTLGCAHFWITLIGTYLIYFPMYYLGVLGMPRWYYAYEGYSFIPSSTQTPSTFITVTAIIVGLAQLLFLFNLAWSLTHGRKAEANPRRATTLEWQTSQTSPVHGNWGPTLLVVYRWVYEYSPPGRADDFVPQNEPSTSAPDMGVETEAVPVTSILPVSRVRT